MAEIEEYYEPSPYDEYDEEEPEQLVQCLWCERDCSHAGIEGWSYPSECMPEW